ncbi:MAG: hypothetical protein AB1652_02840 [Bacillota bacterium]
MKIKDRLLLGVVAGMGGNLIKLSIGVIAKRKGFAEINGPEKAAGMLIPPHRLGDPIGKAAGYLADSVVASIIGILFTYALSVTGKEKAALKGALIGQASWAALYGALATMGATQAQPVSPKTVLSELVGHTAYGAATAYLIAQLGDPDLFTGKVPLSASPVRQTR